MLWRAIFYSLLLHAAAGILLIVSFDFTPQTLSPPRPAPEIVNAVAVDNQQVQAELDRLQEIEAGKQRQEEQRKQRLAELERQQQTEQQRLERIKQQQQEGERQRRQEQQRLAETREQQQEAERQRQLEEEKRSQAEAERKRIEEQQRQAEAARQKALAEKQRLEEEQRRAEEEALMKQQLAEEEKRIAEEQQRLAEQQRQREAAQAAADQEVINQYAYRIQQAITQQFNIGGLPAGLSCTLQIRTIPGGEVVDVSVVDSSGNSVFDRRAVTAVRQASPLPVPDDLRVFDQMRVINIEFAPQE